VINDRKTILSLLQGADTDGNGKLSVSEAQNQVFKQDGIPLETVARMFPTADNNEDDELDAPEYVNIRRLVRAKNVENAKALLAVSAKNVFAIIRFNSKALHPH
jgi:hypothetical protein